MQIEGLFTLLSKLEVVDAQRPGQERNVVAARRPDRRLAGVQPSKSDAANSSSGDVCSTIGSIRDLLYLAIPQGNYITPVSPVQ